MSDIRERRKKEKKKEVDLTLNWMRKQAFE